ncbi:MAG: histidine ammonia-lyase [Candidatus Hodarchaeota archaeon]
MNDVIISIQGLSLNNIIDVARNLAKIDLSDEVLEKVKKARKTIERAISEERIIYGVNTGFGGLSDRIIPRKDVERLQVNLIRSHSAGVGKPLAKEIVRATMLLRINALARGYSGVSLDVLQILVKMLNKQIHPVVPEKGSVGASGDLAPLAHIALTMIGEGQVEAGGKILSSGEALESANLSPVRLGPKEGLALINGSQLITAIGALNVFDSENILKASQISTALSLEALNGRIDPFDERIHSVRPFKGQIAVAQNISRLIENSQIISDPASKRVQDAYSLRCSPQIIGSSKDTIDYVRGIIEIEINSATDNPLVFPENGDIVSGGNFHGQPIAMALDFLSIALCNVGNICERRIARLIDDKLSGGLPPFLVKNAAKGGLSSGFMTAQATAASLAAENRCLSNPSSVNSISTNANQEDLVSMGLTAAGKARDILRNTKYIIAVELLCAAQGLEFRGVDKAGIGTSEAYNLIRKVAPSLEEDSELSPLIEDVANLIQQGELVNSVEKRIGRLV